MKQKYHIHYLWLTLLLLPLQLLSSCSASEVEDADTPSATTQHPISFTALSKWDDAKTRLSENSENTVSFTKDDKIGIFAYYNNSDTPNFMNNQLATCTSADGTSTSWSYSPVKYWPANPNDQLSFYAYYPYKETEDDEMIKIDSQINSQQGPTLTYNWSDSSIDLMAAKKIGCKNQDQKGSVPLSFEHLLSRIRFTFRNNWEDKWKTYRMGINYLHFECNVNHKLEYNYGSAPNYTEDAKKAFDPQVINAEEYYEYNSNDQYVDIVSPFYIVPGFIKNITLEIGIDVYEKNSEQKWEKITEHTTPTYVFKPTMTNVENVSSGNTITYQISYKPNAGIVITTITDIDGWKEIENENKI